MVPFGRGSLLCSTRSVLVVISLWVGKTFGFRIHFACISRLYRLAPAYLKITSTEFCCSGTYAHDSWMLLLFLTHVNPCVIKLRLGKLLVNLLQVVKRTNTPLIPQQMASTAGPWFFRVVGSNTTSCIIKLFQAFSHVELEKCFPRYPQEMKPLG